jgi:hypothetical protein
VELQNLYTTSRLSLYLLVQVSWLGLDEVSLSQVEAAGGGISVDLQNMVKSLLMRYSADRLRMVPLIAPPEGARPRQSERLLFSFTRLRVILTRLGFSLMRLRYEISYNSPHLLGTIPI